ncbi:MAG: hypothetical protein K0R14_2200 [Burkholderiales bacterium]|nr:hypothetical protein [Burkholderiales bacterium]
MRTNYVQDVINGSDFFAHQNDIEDICRLVQKDGSDLISRRISMSRDDWFDDDVHDHADLNNKMQVKNAYWPVTGLW